MRYVDILVLVFDGCFIALRQRTGAMAPGLVPCVEEEEGDLVVHRRVREVPSSPSPWEKLSPKHPVMTWTKRGQKTDMHTWRPSAVDTSSQILAVGTWRRAQAVVAIALVVFDVGLVFDGMRIWKSTLTPC